jgi:hypothetical protein
MTDNLDIFESSESLCPPPDQSLPLPGYIFYEKKPSGYYGRYFKSTFCKDGKVYHEEENLGRVINREQGIFRNRKRGYFTFSLNNGYGEYNKPETAFIYNLPQHLTLHFGDVWLIDQIMKRIGLEKVLENIIPNDPAATDTLKAMVSFRLLETKAYSYAEEWYRKSYAKELYPSAAVESSQLSGFHKYLGQEIHFRNFFNSYLQFIMKNHHIDDQKSLPILIDSTGLPNDIKTHLTAISNHNGDINNEIRLIYIVDKDTKLPIYFRYIPGNIIDNSTLITTINSLMTYDVNIKLIIMDAGYPSNENLSQLMSLNIPFITRMPKNRKDYKDLMAIYGKNLRKVVK